MIVMVMGQEDEVELAAMGLDRSRTCFGIGGIDEGQRAGGVVAQKPGVVVGEHRDGMGGEGHDRLPSIGRGERECPPKPPSA